MNTDVFKIARPTCNDYILTVGGDAGQGCFYFFHRRKRRTMRAGAEQGRWANASLDWLPQLLKERLRDRDAGMVGFLNSKPSWKTKQNNKVSFLIGAVSGTGRNNVGEISHDAGTPLLWQQNASCVLFCFSRYMKKCQR